MRSSLFVPSATRVKIEKCEFMKEIVEYLGFEVGYQ